MGFAPIARCRVCDSPELFEVLDLGVQPLANAFVGPTEPPPPRFPLVAVGCAECSVVQLSGTVDPRLMFDDYAYFSSYSSSMVATMRDLAQRTVTDERLEPRDLVLEVASNDGYLLRHYRDLGIRTLGVEPAANVAAVALDEGIDTRVEYFTARLAADLRREGVAPRVIHANNVIAHVPDVHDFVEGLRLLLHEDGIVIVETPYLVDLIDRVLFDTIYHEHVYYWPLAALVRVFAEYGLVLARCEHIDVHGGSLRAVWRHRRSDDHGLEATYLGEETARRLTSADSYAVFARDVAGSGRRLVENFEAVTSSGLSLAGYGAAAKATVLLNYAAVGESTLCFVVDRNPAKQGRLVPGTRIPIVSLDVLQQSRPDALAVFVWNIWTEVAAQLHWYVESGGRLLDPLAGRRDQ